jgi:hypothetical protein
MKKAAVLSILIAAILLAVAVIAEAQQQKKVPRIGVLFPGSPATLSPLRLARMASRPTCCFDLESRNVKNCEFTGLTYSPSFSEAAARVLAYSMR